TKNGKTPFAKIIKGNGNETKSKYEGFMEKNFIGTYIHGPLLPKNPEIVKYILEYVFEKKYQINKKVKIDNIEFYKDAKKIILERG
ncbi:MAG: hypothetical protein JJV90_01830, partial [Spiroplasma sp.]|nr:hypothetical protein [Mycoplasmatales bacterium]